MSKPTPQELRELALYARLYVQSYGTTDFTKNIFNSDAVRNDKLHAVIHGYIIVLKHNNILTIEAKRSSSRCILSATWRNSIYHYDERYDKRFDWVMMRLLSRLKEILILEVIANA